MAFAVWPVILAIVCCMTFDTALGQVIVLSENFEHGGSMPSGWSMSYPSLEPLWEIVDEGIGNSSYPSSAHGGTYCAGIYYNDSDCDWNELLTPYINLSAYQSATLTFYLHKQQWGSDVDDLTVYYRNSTGGSWTQLFTYSGSISSWTLETLTLPNLSANYQIKFKGNACWGYGVYIDDVVVTAVSPGGSSSSCESITMVGNISRTIECGTTYCFYDSGGENGQYSTSQSYTATFASTGTITMTFSSFNTESGYDEMTIYDGNNEIGTYSGTSSPGTVVATTGRLIVEWYSDSSVTRDGWAATVTASGCGSAPQVITGSTDCESAQAFCATNENSGYDMIVESGSSDTYPFGMCSFFR
ncbi:MAG: choice-of-anchor J domain-containing protein, partial [Bacteroidales bacterium]|nr:choice-of-anchor J domain-containing protein [Bacteroidales bacterium]